MSDFILYGRETCPWCVLLKELLSAYGIDFEYVDLLKNPPAIERLQNLNLKTIPQFFYKDEHIGGYEESAAFLEKAFDDLQEHNEPTV